MTTFCIPTSDDEADARQRKLGDVSRATEFERAAIVYACVTVGTHGGDRSKAKCGLAAVVTPRDYATRGHVGLRSHETVRRYHRVWTLLIEDKLAKPVRLGDEVELTDSPDWSEYYKLAARSFQPDAEQAKNDAEHPSDSGPVDLDIDVPAQGDANEGAAVVALENAIGGVKQAFGQAMTLENREHIESALDTLAQMYRSNPVRSERDRIAALVRELATWQHDLISIIETDLALTMPCPTCKARPARKCVNTRRGKTNPRTNPHKPRVNDALIALKAAA